MAEKAADEGRRGLAGKCLLVDPAHQRAGGVQVAAVLRRFIDRQQQQRGPGDVAGGRAHLVAVFEPFLARLVPPARQRHRPIGHGAGAVGVAHAAIVVMAVTRDAGHHAIGNPARGGGLPAGNQRDAGQRVVIDKGRLAQRGGQGLATGGGLVAAEHDRALAGQGADAGGQRLAGTLAQLLAGRIGRRGGCSHGAGRRGERGGHQAGPRARQRRRG